jgi:hypothetical protein
MNDINSTPETISIPLTKGYSTTVSVVDADLAKSKWFSLCAKQTTKAHALKPPYAAHRQSHLPGERQVIEYMHRVILARMLGRELIKGEQVDHINGDPLNNTRENLRLATSSQNLSNRRKPVNNTSGYKCVIWNKQSRKWQARTKQAGRIIYLGLFDTPEEAHAAYCAKAKELHGEFWNPG